MMADSGPAGGFDFDLSGEDGLDAEFTSRESGRKGARRMMMQGQMVMLGCGDDLFAVPVARVQERSSTSARFRPCRMRPPICWA